MNKYISAKNARIYNDFLNHIDTSYKYGMAKNTVLISITNNWAMTTIRHHNNYHYTLYINWN